MTRSYDALGRRIQRFLVGGKENTKFICDGADVIADDNSGTLTKYINGPGVDKKLRMQTGSDVRCFIADHLGSTGALTDSSGNVSIQRTPFGSESVENVEPRVSKYADKFAGAFIEETYPTTRVVRYEYESDGDLSRIWGKANQNAPERTYANSFSSRHRAGSSG